MDYENPDNLPLVERVNKAEFFARELSEHLRQAYLPRLAKLRSSSKRLDPAEVSDQTMFDEMSAVMKADEFAADLFTRLTEYLDSIQKDGHHVLGVDIDLSTVKTREAMVDIQDIVVEEEL